jgi:hypothetical protein
MRKPIIDVRVLYLSANRLKRAGKNSEGGKYEAVLHRPVHVGPQRCGGGRRLHVHN